MKKTPQKVSSYEEIKKVDKRKFVIVKGFVFSKKEYNQVVKDVKSTIAEDLEKRTGIVEKFCKKNGIKNVKDITEIYHSIDKIKKTTKQQIKEFQKEQDEQKIKEEKDIYFNLKEGRAYLCKGQNSEIKLEDKKICKEDRLLGKIICCEKCEDTKIIQKVLLSIIISLLLFVILYLYL